MTTPALVSLADIEHRYDTGLLALSGISLDIAPGTFVSLLGPSGCGKSTLLRIIAGLLTPTSGHVDCRVKGKTGELGFVFQEPTLMPWATVRANVALPNALGATPDSDVDSVIARVGLKDFAGAYPRELSGGMRMRASIARALGTKPKLLLMDEPFAALDEITRFKLNDDLIALWTASGTTVVFVTHSVREAVFLSERVVVMASRPGRIAADLVVKFAGGRRPELRLSHAFADECARISSALGDAAA